MTHEHRQAAEQVRPEKERDLTWIAENQDIFWLSATVAYEILGRGALVVDLSSEPMGNGHRFSYSTEGELELQDEDLRHFEREADRLHRETLALDVPPEDMPPELLANAILPL